MVTRKENYVGRGAAHSNFDGVWQRLRGWLQRPGTKREYLVIAAVVGGLLFVYVFLRFMMNPCGDYYTCL